MHAIEDMRNTLRVGAPMTENEGRNRLLAGLAKARMFPV